MPSYHVVWWGPPTSTVLPPLTIHDIYRHSFRQSHLVRSFFHCSFIIIIDKYTYSTGTWWVFLCPNFSLTRLRVKIAFTAKMLIPLCYHSQPLLTIHIFSSHNLEFASLAVHGIKGVIASGQALSAVAGFVTFCALCFYSKSTHDVTIHPYVRPVFHSSTCDWKSLLLAGLTLLPCMKILSHIFVLEDVQPPLSNSDFFSPSVLPLVWYALCLTFSKVPNNAE